jgi:hypothetical protein
VLARAFQSRCQLQSRDDLCGGGLRKRVVTASLPQGESNFRTAKGKYWAAGNALLHVVKPWKKRGTQTLKQKKERKK